MVSMLYDYIIYYYRYIMIELVTHKLVSQLHTRLYAWIRITGSMQSDGWCSCRATNRALGFLDILEIEYTIEKSKAWFTLLNDENELIDFWQIHALPFIEEFYYMRNLAVIPKHFNISDEEATPFVLLLSSEGYKYGGSLNNVQTIRKIR